MAILGHLNIGLLSFLATTLILGVSSSWEGALYKEADLRATMIRIFL